MSWPEAVFGIFVVFSVVVFLGFVTGNLRIDLRRHDGRDSIKLPMKVSKDGFRYYRD